MRKALSAVLSAWAAVSAAASDLPPPIPGRETWTFREELARPAVYRARESYTVVDGYGLAGNLETVRADLARYMRSAAKPSAKKLYLRKGAVDGHESYRVEPVADGVALTAGDDDGLRRAVCCFQDREAAGDLRAETRRPWLRHRISRCFFGPIKRAPYFRDELMDDIDYYPDEYLNRLAHEGVNGLWLTIELRDIVETSFNVRGKDAPRRLAKLRRTVEKCLRYGIRTWVFCIEPRRMEPGDPLLAAHPVLGATTAWDGSRVMCPFRDETRRYLTEAFADLFRQVPGLAGCLNISHGERPTTCLSMTSPTGESATACPRCSKVRPWEIHARTASAIVEGMRRSSPGAEFLSWFYQPQVEYHRAPWVPEVARHLPDGVTMLYNFESGAVKDQLGRYRPGGDYWLSYVGPSPAFSAVAESAREAGGRIGAKIQVGCSHECATVPFVPVPGLLYRKYAEMRKARCTTVMQCWYFGNYPGVMNKAAGELAFSDFSESEDAFLLRLAKPEWGDAAADVAKLWRDLSDAYADYPLSNDMQYYGPFHAGVAWPLLPDVELRPLGRTWKPQDVPSGDAIGECLENHTLDEACVLAWRMAAGARRGRATVDALRRRFAGNPDRLRDLGVMEALELLFSSGSDIFDFYRARAQALYESRRRGNPAGALRALATMRACVEREKDVTRAMLPLAEGDSRIGFHSEAEAHQFHPAKLRWRLGRLDAARARIDEIAGIVRAGGTYPLSAVEASAPCAKAGAWVEAEKIRFRVSLTPEGDLAVDGEVKERSAVTLVTFDDACVSWPRLLTLRPDGRADAVCHNVVTPKHAAKTFTAARTEKGWTFRAVLDSAAWGPGDLLRPGWLDIRFGHVSIWPAAPVFPEYRLNIGKILPGGFGRLLLD